MTQPLAYLNGKFVPASHARVDVTDWGFVQGVTLAEQIRTFRGHPFKVAEHSRRLDRGLKIVQREQALENIDIASVIGHVVDHNVRLFKPQDDLGICVFVTPGQYPSFSLTGVHDPCVCVHSYPLPFHMWHNKYVDGSTLISVNTRQVPTDCWPSDLKCRSRMHYYLATLEARRHAPNATPLLMDHDECVTETPTANIVGFFSNTGLISPPQDKILNGISLDYLRGLAHRLGVPFQFRDLTLTDLDKADEIMLTSTPFCILPVLRLNARTLNGPGPIFRQLLSTWSQDVGVEIIRQAEDFADRT